MYEYIHGGDIYSAQKPDHTAGLLDFSVNINPLGPPEAAIAAMKRAVRECDRYPDPFCRELVQAISKQDKVPPAWIYCGNGAADLIFRVALALKPKKALLLAPTYADYEKALRTVDCRTEYYFLTAANDFAVQEDFLDRITPETDMVFLCNPNNPTGQVCPSSLILKVLEKNRSTMVLVDECFMDFVSNFQDYSAKRLLGNRESHDNHDNDVSLANSEAYDNLLILKAFTKTYAMPGIRLGYLLTANLSLIEKLYQCGQDWSVSNIAQAAGASAIGQKGYLEQTGKIIKEERELLIKELQELGFQVFGSKANYVFFKTTPKTGLEGKLEEKLAARGILIRSCANYRNLNREYYRIAVRNHPDNQRIINALKDLIV